MNHTTIFERYPDATCLVFEENKLLFQSSKKGVAPLLDYYHEHGSKSELTIVDKVVGKGAAILAHLVGADSIHTPIISKDALVYCKANSIVVFTDRVVPYIMNKDQNGRCPIESSVLDIEDPVKGYETIIRTLKQLNASQI